AFYELAKKDRRIYLVVADITAAAGVASFQKESPERFLNVGVAEQMMISMCGGLALRGCIPFAYTIATFTIYRPFEQVRVDCAYQNLPDPFRLGKIRFIKRGTDICFLSYGPVTKTAVEVANRIEKEKGKSCAVVSVHSLKPLDKTGIQEMLARFPIVVVVEEHARHGGLGSRVKEIAWDSGAQCRLKPFSLRDEFIHASGSHAVLLKSH